MSRLFKKTLLVVVLLFGMISTCVSLLSGWNIYKSMNEGFENKGRSIAVIIADSSVGPLLSDKPAMLQSMIDEYLQIREVAYVLVTDKNGVAVAHTFVPSVPAEVRDPAALLNHVGKGDFGTGISKQKRFINVVSPIVGGVAGYVLVGMDKTVIKDQIVSIIVQQQLLIFLLFLISVLICKYLISRIAKPLMALEQHATKLATVEVGSISQFKDEINWIAERSNDEIGALARSFIYMESELDESVKTLSRNIAEQERINTELEVAREIQLKMLPPQSELSGLHKNAVVEAMIRSAKEVGGDLYDCFLLKDADGKPGNRLFFTIGDVSGKGVPAALFMSMTCTLIRTNAGRYTSPGALLESVNRELSKNNDACMFVTVFCGILDLETGELIYSSAGHNPPYMLSQENGVEPLICPHGVVLGVHESATYTDSRMAMKANECLFLFTDGVTEAMNKNCELYADDRLVELLAGQLGSDPASLLRATVLDVDRFAAEEPQADDITMLALRRRSG